MKGERKLAKLQLKPGMIIDEKEFHGMSGVTRFSLEFWDKIKGKLGEIEEIDQTFTEKDWYITRITDSNGITVLLRGFATGYSGEGPRGLAQILNEIGMNGNIALEQETFKIIRD